MQSGQILNLERQTLELSNGEKLAYIEYNKDKSNPIILVHGNIVSSIWWYPLFEILKQSNHRIIALDLRGFGKSSYNNPVEKLDDFAEDIALFQKQLNIEKATYAGWSLGGCIVMKLAALYPELVNNMVLVASGDATGIPMFKEDGVTPCESKEDLKTSPQLKTMLDIQANENYEMLATILKMVIFNGKGGDAMWGLYKYDITEKTGDGSIGKIQCKSIVYHGEKDLVIPIQRGKQIAEELGEKCELIVKEDAAHAPMYDYPEEVAQKIVEFAQI